MDESVLRHGKIKIIGDPKNMFGCPGWRSIVQPPEATFQVGGTRIDDRHTSSCLFHDFYPLLGAANQMGSGDAGCVISMLDVFSPASLFASLVFVFAALRA